ncbi:MAG: hypothetical protein KAJ75_10020 [Alphaproteobacteria bacterium]|nr:hypothetical protein [Alphaproteobacteria bacterium]
MSTRTLLFVAVFIALAVSSFGGRQLAMAESSVKKESSQAPSPIIPVSYHERDEQKVSKKTKSETESNSANKKAYNLDSLKEDKTAKLNNIINAPVPEKLPKKRELEFIAASSAAASIRKPAVSIKTKNITIINPKLGNPPTGMASFGQHLDGTPFIKMGGILGNKNFTKPQKAPTVSVEEKEPLQKLPQEQKTPETTSVVTTVEGSFLSPNNPSDEKTQPLLNAVDNAKKVYTKTKTKILDKIKSREQEGFTGSPWLVAKSAIKNLVFPKQKHQEKENKSVVNKTNETTSTKKKNSKKNALETIRLESSIKEKTFKVRKLYSKKKNIIKDTEWSTPAMEEKPVSTSETNEPIKTVVEKKPVYKAQNLDNIQLATQPVKNESKEKTFKVRKLYGAKKNIVKKIEWSPASNKKDDKTKKKTHIKKRKKKKRKPLLRLLEPKIEPVKKEKTVDVVHQLEKHTVPFTDKIKNFFSSEIEFNETTKSNQNVKSLFNSLVANLSISDTEKLIQKTKIQPTELKIQFEPYSAAMSGQTLKWLRTISEIAKKDTQIMIEVRMSGSINVSSTLQARRYSLIQGALSSQGIHSSRIRVVLTNRAPDSVVLRSLRIVESSQFFERQSGTVVNRRAFNW